LVGATFFVATLLTRTMVPLRVSGMIANVFFMAFGVQSRSKATQRIFGACLGAYKQ